MDGRSLGEDFSGGGGLHGSSSGGDCGGGDCGGGLTNATASDGYDEMLEGFRARVVNCVFCGNQFKNQKGAGIFFSIGFAYIQINPRGSDIPAELRKKYADK